MSKKKIFIFIGLFALALGLIVGGIVLVNRPSTNKPKEYKEDKSYKPKESLLKDIEHEQFKITNIEMKKIDDHYEFNFTITNISDKQTEVQIINYVFYDENGKEVGRIENELQPVLPGKSTNYITPSKDEKLFNAAEIKIELSPLV